MPTKDPRVDAYIAQAQPFARPILRHLRKVVHAGCPDVVETMKWRMPHFDYKGPFSGMPPRALTKEGPVRYRNLFPPSSASSRPSTKTSRSA